MGDLRWEMGKRGKWTLDLNDLGWVIDLSINIMSVSWQRAIFCLLSALKSFRWVPVYLVTMVTMGPVCLMKLTRKWKLVRTLGFFLDFFPQLILTTGSWDSSPVCLVPCGDHGDHGTSVSDEIDQKTKVGQNTWFFLRFFSPAHFAHWKLR